MPVYTWITLITIPGLWELIVILSTPCELVVLLKFYSSDHSQYLVVSHFKRDTNAATLKEAGQDMSEGLTTRPFEESLHNLAFQREI